MAAVSICSDFGAPKNKVWHCFHCFPIYFPWNIRLIFNIFSFLLYFSPLIIWQFLAIFCFKILFVCFFYSSGQQPKWSEDAQSCLTLCDPMDCSPPGSSIHRIFQARVLYWVAISFSRGSSRPRDWIRVSCIVGRCFTIWATREIKIRL